ncbi:hypothetical protein R1sor_014005 [Riccia sorocarpa]|uniref:Uncharacterized protein n=1 Tax=Riccia sorocarpa TaxID=122646 RepID=A0ABD3HA10_9MARC
MMDRISTAFEYIFGNSRNDPKVARALAGWPDSKVYEYNPGHILVSRIVMSASDYNLQVEDLLSIGRRLFQSFQRRNLGQLSIEESPQSIAGRLDCLTGILLEFRVDVNEQLIEIRREMRQEIRSLREEVLQSHTNNHLVSVSPTAAISEDIHASHVGEDHEGNCTNADERRQFPSHLVKLSGITLADAYIEFVRWGLLVCSTANKQEYKAWIDLRQLYTLAREPESSFCEIPNPPVFHGEEFGQWRDHMKPKIHEVAGKIQQRIERHSDEGKETDSSSRKRKLTSKATASLKQMRSMVGKATVIDLL